MLCIGYDQKKRRIKDCNLANEIICNHDQLHNTRRLHWPCDCSKQRSSTFRKACDTKARTQGHVEAELAKPEAAARAAAAAAHFTNTDVPCIWKQKATWESKAEVQDDSKHIAEADEVPGNQEVNTNALVKNEAVKEELKDTNTKAIERIKIGLK